MIARRLLQLLRHPFAIVFVAPLGAFFALLAVKALAVVAGLLGMTAIHDILRDVGVNAGPLAAGGGAGAGVGAAAGGGKSGRDKGARERDKTDREMEEKVQREWKLKEDNEKYFKEHPEFGGDRSPGGAPPSAFENAKHTAIKGILTGGGQKR